MMGLALSQRLGRAFSRTAVTPGEKDKVLAAAEKVETFNQLPAPIKSLVEDMEARPGPPPRR